MGILGSTLRDLRYSVRLVVRSPGLSLAVVLIAGIGVGAGSAVYSMAREVLWPDLPVRDPERLVTLHHRHVEQGYYSSFAAPQVEEIARDLGTLAVATGYLEGVPANLGGAGGAVERVQAALVGADYFGALGLHSAQGRLLGPSDDRQGDAALVLSHGLWRGRFGADPDVVGSTVTLNGHPFRIVGVAPPAFQGVEYGASIHLWVPVSQWRRMLPWMTEEMMGARGAHWLSVMGRLAPGVDLPASRAEVTAHAAALGAAYPDTDADWDLVMQPFSQGRVFPGLQEDVYSTLGILGAVVVLVLVLICANIANLLLARSPSRAREMAIRRALGARRGDLVRQSLVESLLLALGAGGAGVLVAAWAIDLLGGIRPVTADSLILEGRLDAGVVAFALLLCLIIGTLFGLPAAWRSTGAGTAERLRGVGVATRGPRASGRRRGLELRDALAAAQIAVCLALVVGAILLQRSFWNLQATPPGFEPRGVLLAAVDLGLSGYEADDGLLLYRRLREQLEALPQVESASLGLTVPLARQRLATDLAAGGRRLNSSGNIVGPGYLSTLGIRLLRGRDFAGGDDAGAAPVVVVNETLARTLWASGDALDSTLEIFLGGPEPVVATVIGVVADGVYGRLLEARGTSFFFVPALQHFRPTTVIHVRGRELSDPGLAEALRATLAELDPDVPLYDVRSLSEHLDGYLARPRAVALHASLFGLLALALSVVGIYGVVSHRIVERVPEIGVRLAVGATQRDIACMVLGWATTLAAVGVVFGLLTTALFRGVYASLLYGVAPFDPSTFAGTAALLVAVAIVAAWLPARRASRLDPASSLRAS